MKNFEPLSIALIGIGITFLVIAAIVAVQWLSVQVSYVMKTFNLWAHDNVYAWLLFVVVFALAIFVWTRKPKVS